MLVSNDLTRDIIQEPADGRFEDSGEDTIAEGGIVAFLLTFC